jgi:hypothetical protein
MLCESELILQQTETADIGLAKMHLLLHGQKTLNILLLIVDVVSNSTKTWRYALCSVVNMPKTWLNMSNFIEHTQFQRLRTQVRIHTHKQQQLQLNVHLC